MAWTLPPMTPRMAAFVSAYFAHERKVSTAAKSLGMAKSEGFKMMRDERVKAAIALDGVLPPGAVTAKDSRRAATAAKRKAAVEEAASVAEAPTEPMAPLPADGVAYDATKVCNRLALIAEATATDFFKQVKRGGKIRSVPRDIHELPPGAAYALQRVKVTAAGSIEFSFYSKLDALRLLGQATGAFNPGEGEGDAPVGGTMTEEALSYEKRLERYGNVLKPSFGPKAVKSD